MKELKRTMLMSDKRYKRLKRYAEKNNVSISEAIDECFEYGYNELILDELEAKK
jgi:hypothetical protein